MKRDPRAYLWDVDDAAQAIQDFVKGMVSMATRTDPLVANNYDPPRSQGVLVS